MPSSGGREFGKSLLKPRSFNGALRESQEIGNAGLEDRTISTQ